MELKHVGARRETSRSLTKASVSSCFYSFVATSPTVHVAHGSRR